MSDPMTNMEIEDVLSSIRRLVSEDHRAPPRAPPKPDRMPDKLVLTPALRIVPTVAPPPAATPDLPPAPAAPQNAVSHEAAAAVMEAALFSHADDWEPDGSEVSSTSDWTVEWEAGATPEAEPPEEIIAVTPENAPPAGPASALDQDDSEPEPNEFAEENDDFPQDDRVTAAFFRHDATTVRSGHPMPDQPDPVASFGDDFADPLVDEESLRDLVRDILREELQGALGERITRNVRKLVRAEINRALAARELD